MVLCQAQPQAPPQRRLLSEAHLWLPPQAHSVELFRLIGSQPSPVYKSSVSTSSITQQNYELQPNCLKLQLPSDQRSIPSAEHRLVPLWLIAMLLLLLRSPVPPLLPPVSHLCPTFSAESVRGLGCLSEPLQTSWGSAGPAAGPACSRPHLPLGDLRPFRKPTTVTPQQLQPDSPSSPASGCYNLLCP